MERSIENVIDWVNGDSRAALTLSQTKYINRLRKLHEADPQQVGLIENQDGSIYASVPLSYIKISPPRKVSDEQRAAFRERARGNNRSSFSETSRQ